MVKSSFELLVVFFVFLIKEIKEIKEFKEVKEVKEEFLIYCFIVNEIIILIGEFIYKNRYDFNIFDGGN